MWKNQVLSLVFINNMKEKAYIITSYIPFSVQVFGKNRHKIIKKFKKLHKSAIKIKIVKAK